MRETIFTVEENKPLNESVFMLKLKGDTSDITLPGQFVNIKVPGVYLRRPVSVCDVDEGVLTLAVKKVGAGTETLFSIKNGETLDLLTGLGNGFDTSVSGSVPLLIGGGIGTAPLFNLTKKLRAEGKLPIVILGFNTKSEIFLYDEFLKEASKLIVTTMDNSFAMGGAVTDGMKSLGLNEYSYVYSCGPMKMIEAVAAQMSTKGQFSLEERFGCGFGACMGCSRKTANGYKRVCKDGPVFYSEEMIW